MMIDHVRVKSAHAGGDTVWTLCSCGWEGDHREWLAEHVRGERREAAIYAAAKAHAVERGIDLTTSLNQQALVPDEFRWMRAAIAAYEELLPPMVPVRSEVLQVRCLMESISRDLNDVGPWGNGYRQALSDLDRELDLRFPRVERP